MKMKFTKMHGCGNDYVYVDCMDKMLPNPGKISEFISRRRFGIGSDGLICICPSDKADFRMRMFNADASEGKMCGNGARCIAKFVYDKGLTHKDTITLDTLGGLKTIHMTVENGKVSMAEVDMEKAITRAKDVPMDWPEETCIDRDVTFTRPDGSTFTVRGTAVSMGNPHFVTFVDDVETAPVEEVGKVIEHSPLFPERVNVEFVQVVSPDYVKFRVWERGSGETWACGTGACAVGYTCVRLGKAGKRNEFLKVEAKGGLLQVKTEPDDTIILKGPATTVYDGVIDLPEDLLK
ncbi:MAG: diaminopimelate epimerase [Acidaminococcus sp.]|nr:diaminopimelate epimerase [Acidaminococcus timonensis]MDD6570480.1 diaminopimelate epimerase [Acidaminococcus sp.]